MMSKKIDYELLLRNASISVVKEILRKVAVDGFFKKQHLYVTFSLDHKGVKISKALREEFDDEITIVLQYEFWDLVVDDYGFSVTLAFEHSDETIYIPFSSLLSVSDPSEDFSLEFSPDFSDLKEDKIPEKHSSEESNNIISLDAFRKKN